MTELSLPEKLWEHPNVAATQIDAFRRFVNKEHGLQLDDYHALWRWSTESINDFWMRLWEFTGVKASVKPTFAIDPSHVNRLSPIPEWFPEARLNFAQNILESVYAPVNNPGKVVITGIREGGQETEHLALPELKRRVGRTANALARVGVGASDRVACIGSNSVDTFVIFLATVSRGAIFTCCSPETGPKGIMDRFLQVAPKVMFADDWVLYNGKRIPCLEKVTAVARQLREKAKLELLVLVPRFGTETLERHDGEEYLDAFLQGVPDKLNYIQNRFSHPLVIVYSSGTTGQPKCLVHTVGGVLTKQKLEQILCIDMNEGSVYLQYSSTNWIMYLYSISGLLSGARSVLYDGSPAQPSLRGFLQLLAREKVTHFGTSAHYLSLLQAAGITRASLPPLDSLKCITSTGSVLVTPQYHWVYETFGNVQLSSIAGGTDIAGAFVGGAPNLPVYAGWCQARTLGMKVQIFSDEGQAIESSGEAGELVCTAPFPSQPAFFWGDESGTRYRDAYFARFPGIWHQGDYIRMDPPTQGIQFLGRSDGVLNPSGVRFGSAEIYNALTAFPQIEDSICVGQRRPKDQDEQVLLFIKLGNSTKQQQPRTALLDAIRAHIRKELSPRHVPKYIFETPEIPMTVNGKKTELPVKKIVCGQHVVPSSTIANPECLQWYRGFVDVEERARELGGWSIRGKL